MNKWQFLRRTDLDPYQKLIVMVCLGRYFHWKKWMAEVGEETIKEIQAKTDWKEKAQECFETLTPRDVRVLNLRYGLEDGKSRTYEEVGRELCLTRERIRQIETKALGRLRHPARLRRLGLEENK